jgi:hypothetical protein
MEAWRLLGITRRLLELQTLRLYLTPFRIRIDIFTDSLERSCMYSEFEKPCSRRLP